MRLRFCHVRATLDGIAHSPWQRGPTVICIVDGQIVPYPDSIDEQAKIGIEEEQGALRMEAVRVESSGATP
ncbi:hypothetical protein RJT34_25609 [Clitoria ternatea]|uniref:Uncharacterized protein n=1 Tax=Clitoria ternatea TaxID=43366 RepID=A0AAN9FWH8_CLITE